MENFNSVRDESECVIITYHRQRHLATHLPVDALVPTLLPPSV